MKRIVLIFTTFLIFIMSACSTKSVVDNETTIKESNIESTYEKNNTESTYDLNAAIRSAKCVTEYPDTATVDDFDTVILGKYEQDGDESNGAENIEWIILEKKDDKALLLSKNVLYSFFYFYPTNYYSLVYLDKEKNGYREKEMYDEWRKSNQIEISAFRYHMQHFSRNFSKYEKVIPIVDVGDKEIYFYDDFEKKYKWAENDESGVFGDDPYDDVLFLTFSLSANDINKYFGNMNTEGSNSKSKAHGSKYMIDKGLFVGNGKGTNGFMPYYTRSEIKEGEKGLKWVGVYGHLYNEAPVPEEEFTIGIRPAMWVEYK